MFTWLNTVTFTLVQKSRSVPKADVTVTNVHVASMERLSQLIAVKKSAHTSTSEFVIVA